MAKDWHIIVTEGDETKLDTVTSCFMLGLADGDKSRVVGGSDTSMFTLASMYLHIMEKITDHQEKHPNLRQMINALNSLQGIGGVADND